MSLVNLFYVFGYTAVEAPPILRASWTEAASQALMLRAHTDIIFLFLFGFDLSLQDKNKNKNNLSSFKGNFISD